MTTKKVPFYLERRARVTRSSWKVKGDDEVDAALRAQDKRVGKVVGQAAVHYMDLLALHIQRLVDSIKLIGIWAMINFILPDSLSKLFRLVLVLYWKQDRIFVFIHLQIFEFNNLKRSCKPQLPTAVNCEAFIKFISIDRNVIFSATKNICAVFQKSWWRLGDVGPIESAEKVY